jgi:hypothetical protein
MNSRKEDASDDMKRVNYGELYFSFFTLSTVRLSGALYPGMDFKIHSALAP